MAAKEEKKEEKKAGQDFVELHPTLAKNEYPAKEIAQCKSVMSKVVTKELFDAFKDKKTSTGFTIARAINTGVKNPQSLMGIHAGDIESYSVFGDIFTPVIEMYHKTKSFHAGIEPFGGNNEIKVDIEDKSNIISTRIRVARNIDGFPLAPAQTSPAVKLEIEEIMKKVFKSLQNDDELKGKYYPLDGMDPEQRKQLIADHFLFSGDDDPMQTDSGYHLWFPKGRGIYLSEKKTFLVWLNEGDHLRLISMEKSQNVLSVFNRLAHAQKVIGERIREVTSKKHDGFMMDKRYGAVTCCPTNLGTGMRASVHINLPNLAKKGLDKLNEIASEFKLQIRGLYGEHSEIEENAVVDISNKFRMGYNEQQLVTFMVNGVNKINKLEKENKPKVVKKDANKPT